MESHTAPLSSSAGVNGVGGQEGEGKEESDVSEHLLCVR